MTRPSTQQVTGTLQELLSNADLETTTETGLEAVLRERYATDMSEFKTLIQARPDPSGCQGRIWLLLRSTTPVGQIFACTD